MVGLALFTFLCGAVLAFRYRVMMVVLGILIAWAMVVSAGFAIGTSAGTVALAMIITAVALQLGYLSGSGVRFALVAARARARRPVEAASREPRRA
jgi:putative Ca2+/H+ antiporter (TMEM165/GDT1 family)